MRAKKRKVSKIRYLETGYINWYPPPQRKITESYPNLFNILFGAYLKQCSLLELVLARRLFSLHKEYVTSVLETIEAINYSHYSIFTFMVSSSLQGGDRNLFVDFLEQQVGESYFTCRLRDAVSFESGLVLVSKLLDVVNHSFALETNNSALKRSPMQNIYNTIFSYIDQNAVEIKSSTIVINILIDHADKLNSAALNQFYEIVILENIVYHSNKKYFAKDNQTIEIKFSTMLIFDSTISDLPLDLSYPLIPHVKTTIAHSVKPSVLYEYVMNDILFQLRIQLDCSSLSRLHREFHLNHACVSQVVER